MTDDPGRRGAVDVSVVLPCLDEAGSVGAVVAEALAAMRGAGLRGEVVVADNGSRDGSAAVARAAGARVVEVPARGYGAACHGGMSAAAGRVLVMADADGTYPMDAVPRLVEPVLAGERDLVIASRLRGRIAGDAMPWSHRHIGVPLLTGVLNRFSHITVSDAHSGMRAIEREAYARLRLSTPGMEYASEMIVQAARARLRIGEITIDYRPRIGESKLETWPDGWRHLRYLLLASPTWLFIAPGLASLALGLLLVVPLSFGGVHLGRFSLILHPIFFGAVLTIVGYQMVQFGVLVRACMPLPVGGRDRFAELIRSRITLERQLGAGAVVLVAGAALGLSIVVRWAASGFGPLGQIRTAVAAMTLVVLGVQTVFGAFLFAFFMPATPPGGDR